MSKNSKPQEHLPYIGIGPLCVSVMIALTAGGIVLSEKGLLPWGKAAFLRMPFVLIAALLIVAGLTIYGNALFGAKIESHIQSNTLAQSGVYAWVRNPIYTAFMIFCTAALLIEGNVCLLVLPFVFWGWMTLLLRHTEEKWLLALHGEVYTDYCRRVNRCIPWFPKN